MSKRNLILKIAGVTSTVLLGVALTGTKIGLENKSAITSAMGQTDYKVIDNSDGNVDAEYFKPTYDTIAEQIEAGKKVAEEIEAEGAVLIKNNSALPLNKGSKISLLGVSSVDPAYGGRGSAQMGAQPDPAVTPKEAFTAAGFELNEGLLNFYQSNLSKYRRGRGKINDAPFADIESNGLTEGIAEYGDAAIVTLTRVGGEGGDFSSTGSDGKNGDYLQLSPNEESVLKGLKGLKDAGKVKKIIVLINSSNQIASTFLNDPELGIDAALWIGAPGITGFSAIAKIISGEVTPSGHLSDTYWYDHKLNPVTMNFGAYKYPNAEDYDLPTTSKGVDPKYSTYDVYQEGVYLGYRYAETRYADKVTGRDKTGDFDYSKTISHPFGYGESYTEFEFSNYKVEKGDGEYTVSVDVKNVGSKYTGKDVVQIYAQRPYNDKNIERGIEVPAVELVGFAKTKALAPGETETVKVKVDERELTVYDASVEKTYIINDGEYFLTAAEDSHEAINNILAAQGYNKTNGMTSEGNADLAKKFNLGYDSVKYSVASTGKKITNLFDNVDMNKYEGRGDNKITYLSRNDWEGTFPTTNVKLVMTSGLANDLVAQDDLSAVKEDNVEYPKMGVEGTKNLIDLRVDADGNPIPYDSVLWDDFMNQLTWDDLVQLVSNGLRQTPQLDKVNKPKTVDHNGPAGLTQAYGENPFGLAARKNDPDKDRRAPYYPSAGIVSATFNKDLARKFGDMLGNDAIWAGYAGFYGIAINTHRSPYEGRAFEYMSEDPFLAGTMATEEVIGLQANGCNAYIKHFALNEQETQRNGVQIWANEQTLREIYLRPFEKAVVEGDAHNAMASFTRIGATYNPASHALLTDFLRGELGMKGLVVTDMYSIGYSDDHMPTFILAGCDLPDGEVTEPYAQFKENHGEFAWALRESAKRVLYSTVISNAMNGIKSGTIIVSVTPGWLISVYSLDAVLGVLWLGTIGTAVYFGVKGKNGKKKDEE